jgi:hypothetical protein
LLRRSLPLELSFAIRPIEFVQSQAKNLIFPLDEYLSPSSRQSCFSLLPLPGIELIFSIDQSVVGSSMTALDFSKPQFDLVQPRAISGRVMERNFGMISEKTVRLLESCVLRDGYK